MRCYSFRHFLPHVEVRELPFKGTSHAVHGEPGYQRFNNYNKKDK